MTAQEPTLQERLRGLKWMINCEARGLVQDETAYKAADRIDELEAALATMTDDRDLWKQSEETCSAQYNRLEAALKQIASCEKRADGDVVDIARKALGL